MGMPVYSTTEREEVSTTEETVEEEKVQEGE